MSHHEGDQCSYKGGHRASLDSFYYLEDTGEGTGYEKQKETLT